MNRTQCAPPGGRTRSRAHAYNYDNSRPFSVFALAALATLGVTALTWGAHAALTRAAAEEQIAAPPDLKQIIERLEEKAATAFLHGPAA